jgi:hypothetical protein
VKHTPPTERFHDSFRHQTVLAAHDRNGDDALVGVVPDRPQVDDRLSL